MLGSGILDWYLNGSVTSYFKEGEVIDGEGLNFIVSDTLTD